MYSSSYSFRGYNLNLSTYNLVPHISSSLSFSNFSVTVISSSISERRTPFSCFASLSASSSVVVESIVKVIFGVLIFRLATMMISRRRGTPSVTLPAPKPAKWKVLRVIWVDGSPIDWAANTPTASPGSINERKYLSSISARNFFAVKSSESCANSPFRSDILSPSTSGFDLTSIN